MLRNRISAQKSRDRKKKEFDELKIITENLYKENCSLKNKLAKKDNELNQMREILQNICKDCKMIPNNLLKEKINNSNAVGIIEKNGRTFNSSLKYSLMTGLLVVVCLIGALSLKNFGDKMDNSDGFKMQNAKQRILYTNTTNELSANVIEKSTQLALYGSATKEIVKKVPFIITKDIEKIKQKQTNNEIDQNFIENQRQKFNEKIQNKKEKEEKNNYFNFFQSSSSNMCVDTETITYNIENYIEIPEKNHQT